MEYFKNRSTSVGGAAVAVPGHVRGLEAVHQKYGRLPWKRLFEESIALARDGQEYREDLNSVSLSKRIHIVRILIRGRHSLWLES